MASYTELEKLPADAYLNPENFKTEWDERNKPAYRDQQYQSGLDYGRKAIRVVLSYKGVWSADMRDGAMVSSYEGIGYHACTSQLLKGFLDSGCEIVVYRSRDSVSGHGRFVIKESTNQEV